MTQRLALTFNRGQVFQVSRTVLATRPQQKRGGVGGRHRGCGKRWGAEGGKQGPWRTAPSQNQWRLHASEMPCSQLRRWAEWDRDARPPASVDAASGEVVAADSGRVRPASREGIATREIREGMSSWRKPWIIPVARLGDTLVQGGGGGPDGALVQGRARRCSLRRL
jgi:hypothetical protein